MAINTPNLGHRGRDHKNFNGSVGNKLKRATIGLPPLDGEQD